MAEEIRFHIERQAEDLIQAGMTPQEANRRARLEMGEMNSLEEDCRQARGLRWMDEIGRNVQFALRRLRKSPGFTATAILTLALCLGANLAIYAVIDAILVRPLPFREAARLVTIYNSYPKAGVDRDGSSIANYYERRGTIPAFESVSMYGLGTAIVGSPERSVEEEIALIAPQFFATLGTTPAKGREFTDGEMNSGSGGSVILSDGFWREHFAADENVIGREILVNGYPKTVVGVLPSGFRFLSSKPRIYLPMSSSPNQRLLRERHSGGNFVQMIARLAPGVSVLQAQKQIDTQNAALERDDPKAQMMRDAGFHSVVVALHADQVAVVRPILLLLQAGVFALLLIGGANLVNLLLIRGSGRAREIAVRRALGAGMAQLITEISTETFLLSFSGALLAMVVGALGVRLVNAIGAGQLPLGSSIVFDMRLALVGFVAAIVLAVSLAAPVVWLNLRVLSAGRLQGEARGATAGRTAQALQHAFIVAQVAMGLVLLAGSGLLGLSLKRALQVSPGFRADRAIAGRVSLIGDHYRTPELGLLFLQRTTAELERQPGVRAAGIATNIPFSGYNGKSAATVKGEVPRPGESARGIYSYGVSGNYFQAMGLPLRAGRFLTAEDSQRKQRTCVVDEDFARYHWPAGNAVGQELFQGSDSGPQAEAFRVVGVVGSVRQAGLTDDTAQGAVYYPWIYRADSRSFIVLRGDMGMSPLEANLDTAVRQIDPAIAVSGTESMDDRIAESLVVRRSPALLAALFSGISLLLIALGLYGVLSYAVTQRQREIGIRMAVGARPAGIRNQFLFLGLRLLAIGAAIGLSGAWISGRAIQAVLFHVSGHNTKVLLESSALIGLIVLVACILPARRAAAVSPMRALAQE